MNIIKRFYDEVFEPYKMIIQDQFKIHDSFQWVNNEWRERLDWNNIVNGPYLERAIIYEEWPEIDTLHLQQKTIEILRSKIGAAKLYRHQYEVIQKIKESKSTIIATGTNSGKTLSFQIPIINDLISDNSPGLRAIIIYPMNALANDQLEEWSLLLKNCPNILFGIYTGETPQNHSVYEKNLEIKYEQKLRKNPEISEQSKESEKRKLVCMEKERDQKEFPNKLLTREQIRKNPPHILITNFAMLEYILERPVDAPIFEKHRLKYLVMDEIHAYRGAQATEIAFLIRRLKDRLGISHIVCIATSATLANKNDSSTRESIRKFASSLFMEEFEDFNPISEYEKKLNAPSSPIYFRPGDYVELANLLKENKELMNVNINGKQVSLKELIENDMNVYRLKNDLLNNPMLLSNVATALWPNEEEKIVIDGFSSLLTLLEYYSEKYPSIISPAIKLRLHFFFNTLGGLFICLNEECSGRKNGKPPLFFSFRPEGSKEEGRCPFCDAAIIEMVSCRKCGYIFLALQNKMHLPDLGRADNLQMQLSNDLNYVNSPHYIYFSTSPEIPFPSICEQFDEDIEKNEDTFSTNTKNKVDKKEAYLCLHCLWWGYDRKTHVCTNESKKANTRLHKEMIRKITIFHHDIPIGCARDTDYFYSDIRNRLSKCPNCRIGTAFGVPIMRRFMETGDEMGLAITIPLVHFKNTQSSENKILCFSDNRQKAASFPALVEEEIFYLELGKKILQTVKEMDNGYDFITLGKKILTAVKNEELFIPPSRLPDIQKPVDENRLCAEIFSYFGIRDVSRTSVEDYGFVEVITDIQEDILNNIHGMLEKRGIKVSREDVWCLLQQLLTHLRHEKIFNLPKDIYHDDFAFGDMTFKKYIMLEKTGKHTIKWLPTNPERPNYIFDYLIRFLRKTGTSYERKNIIEDSISILKELWEELIYNHRILSKKGNEPGFQLNYDLLKVRASLKRYKCTQCNTITTRNSKNTVCSTKGCNGSLEEYSLDKEKASFYEKWLAAFLPYGSIKSEEHTAQISNNLAKSIEEEFRDTEGINLLSSSTTFELGVNIGGLEKILLRNVPLNTASYLQRIGRAGRGKILRNSICITLCHRNRYEQDVWKNPEIILNGLTKPPVVFLENKVIAQRHFNAVVFSEILRNYKIPLVSNEQNIPIELFLEKTKSENPFRNKNISHLDVIPYFEKIEKYYFTTANPCFSSLPSLEFEEVKKSMIEKYKKVIEELLHEEETLLQVRSSLIKEGEDKKAAEISGSLKKLLKEDTFYIFAKRGFLPRYAFPLDNVELITGSTKWLNKEEVELVRDRSIAITEFSPGSDVIAAKRIYRTLGLYILGEKDKPIISYFSKCPGCKQIRISNTKKELPVKCEVCGSNVGDNHKHSFIEPSNFVADEKARRLRRGSSLCITATTASLIEQLCDSLFKTEKNVRIALKPNGHLFKYNNTIYRICGKCGYAEKENDKKPTTKHHPPRGKPSQNCDGISFFRTYLAHQFISYCLIVEPQGFYPSDVFLSALHALKMGIIKWLNLDIRDISVSWRHKTRPVSEKKQEIEMIFFDNVPGGAGFVKSVYDNWYPVIKTTKDILEKCTCVTSCYDCLKNSENYLEHNKLNRHKAMEMIDLWL